MKTRLFLGYVLLALLLIVGAPARLGAQGTAFTYQGQLHNNGSPASGTYNLTFSLFATNTGGVAIAGPVTNSAVAVSNGLFTVAIDFGAAMWNGQTNWLQIAVETNGAATFTNLSPRQQVTPAPYAIYAASAGMVSGITVQPNEDGAPNVISGSSINFVSSGVIGATIAGGGTTNYFGFSFSNTVTSDYGTVGGGVANTADFGATVSGGIDNTANIEYATVGGGNGNTASNNFGTVSGGQDNTAGGPNSTVGGGGNNTASGEYATVAGGENNIASGQGSFAAGQGAQAQYNGSFVWSDGSASTADTGINQFVARASGGFVLYSSDSGNGLYINNSGNVGINNSSPAAAIDLHGGIIYRAIPGNTAGTWLAGINNSGNFGFVPSTGGSDVAYIDTSGNYHQVSDLRLKQDIKNLDNTLDRLLQLRPVSYRLRTAPANAPLLMGFLAQEVQPLFPEMVGEQTNGLKDLVYSQLVPVAVRSIQELNQKLEERAKALEQELTRKDSEMERLQGKVADLQSQLDKLQKAVARLADKSAGTLAMDSERQERK